MIILKIAFRNIFRHKKRSALTGLMMAGGCALFALSIGMVDGGYGNLIDMFTRDHTGHIQVHKKGYLDKPSIYSTIDNPDSVGKKIQSVAHVQSWAPRVYTPALAFAGKKTTNVRVVGIDPIREARTTRIKYKVDIGRFISEAPLNEAVISDRLARLLKIDLNGEIALITQGADGSIANELFTVVGITGKSGETSGTSTCYMHIKTAQDFLSLGGGVHEIAVVLTDQALTMKTVGLIKSALQDPSLEVDPWQVVESQFYRAMKADIKGSWYTIVIFTIIIAVGVLNTVLMIILERTREFGVLKALGTRPLQIFMLIVYETVFLAVLSIIIGTAVGMSANWWFHEYGITLANPIEYGGYFFDTITAKITLRSLVLPAMIIFGTALIVSIWPAIRAARIIPVKAMRSN
ncbi:ABC transporter permease YtrF precursor [bacterium BMS3Abin10]|nr:ABC transporter permease YtrF precursor [bacterium BMS3Abin10]GBE38524.1 ABC transporter permease YtrF precursor [bacterium BMS3Bbin08]